jgi:hypothetical protein
MNLSRLLTLEETEFSFNNNPKAKREKDRHQNEGMTSDQLKVRFSNKLVYLKQIILSIMNSFKMKTFHLKTTINNYKITKDNM